MSDLIKSVEIVRVSVELIASMPHGAVTVADDNSQVETSAPLWQGNTLTIEGDRKHMPILARQLRQLADEIDRICGGST